PFRPGLSATVDIHTQHDTGLAVPIQAVTTREAAAKSDSTSSNAGSDTTRTALGAAKMKEYVFVYNNGTVKQVEVTTGIQDDTNIRILSGLKEGDEVISRPFNAISKTLKDGSKVEKVDKNSLL